jgi:hypothetical protein
VSSGAATGGDWPAVGVGLPIGGPHAGPAAVEAVATAADRLGFSSVSLSERLLLPAGAGWRNDFGPWTEPQILEDLERAREIGIDEFVWDLNIVGYEPARQVDAFRVLASRLGLTPRR